jgi:hypothetical protein
MKKSIRSRPKRAASMALARRKKPAPAPIKRVEVLPAEDRASPLQVLADGPMMGAAFVGTLKLKPAQIDALRRPVEDREVEWKPLVKDGPPAIPYLSHNGYRDRLDACFGLGGWGMVPVGMPKEKDGVVFVPFALVVDGIPRIYAWGEQSYHENNKQMTYGDALEGAKSNAILRCGKELGIAREMWNRGYLADLKRRLLPAGEVRGGARVERPRQPEPPAQHRDARAKITDKQRVRLWTIARNSGRDDNEVKLWLERTYNLTSSHDITRDVYDDICRAIEDPGDLPERRP